MTDTYKHWVDRVVGGRDAKPLSNGEIVKSSSGEPFGIVKFTRIVKEDFTAELGKKGNHYIYHLYPSTRYLNEDGTLFEDIVAEVFLGVFKREDQIEADWVPEMKAWAVRVSGWTNHIWGDELAERAIYNLDKALRSIS